jgi:pyruvate,water dikinase
VSCAEGEEGCVYDGRASFHVEEIDPDQLPETKTKVMFKIANASAGSRWWRLPADGLGLARMDFVVNTAIKLHPLALTAAYPDKPAHFVDQLATGLSRIAAVH